MVELFTPRLDVLPAAQRRLWDEFDTLPASFVLYGGTGIALHLGHRESMDFRFFGNAPFDPARLLPTIPFLRDAEITQRDANTLSCIVDRGGSVKLSFFGSWFFGLPEIKAIRPPVVAPENGMRVASLLDLAGMKASVVQKRAEAKDHIDIDAILTDCTVDLPLALGARTDLDHIPKVFPLP